MSDRKSIGNILLIDNNPDFHIQVEFGLENFNVQTAISASEGYKLLAKYHFDVLLLDLALDRADVDYVGGLDRILTMKREYPELPVIIVTGDKERETIVAAIENGADDFLYKGEEGFFEKAQTKILKAIKQNRFIQEHKAINDGKNSKDSDLIASQESDVIFLGETPKILEFRKKLKFLGGQRKVSLLITGETGTGKEVAAKYLYANSSRKGQPFVVVNLSAISKDLLESELFGHVKGSFSGAIKDHTGYFEMANKGILFLDEIGEISLDIQVKLLRFLEDAVISKVGSTQKIELDIQIIAATHRNLREEIIKGKFREDFFHRLNRFPLHLPSLRDRKADLELLISYYLKIPKENVSQQFTEAAFKKLKGYNWPGNIRELVNAIEQIELNQKYLEKEVIDEECLPEEIKNYEPGADLEKIQQEFPNLKLEEQVALARLREIEEALLNCMGKKGLAAEKLGKNNDGIRYEIKTYFKKYPDFFEDFIEIKKAYQKTLKKVNPSFPIN